MLGPPSRRTILAAAATMIAAPAVRIAAADEPLLLRCSIETVPSHARNGIIRDYLGKLEAAAAKKGTSPCPDAPH